MSKRDLVIFLFKWKASIAGIFLLVVAAASVVIFLAPPSYVANSRVLVERNRPPVLRTVHAPSMDLAEALNTEAEIFVSRTVMSNVVDKLKPYDRPKKPSRLGTMIDGAKSWMEDAGLLYAQSPRERWIQTLQKNVKVKPSIDSSILKISYGDEDPLWSARLVNAALDEYIAQHVRVFSAPGTSQIYLDRLQAIESELNKHRSDLAQRKLRLKLSAVDETRRDLVRRGGELNSQIETAETDLQALLTRFEDGYREVEVSKGKLSRLRQAAVDLRNQLLRLESEQSSLDDVQLQIASLENAYKDYASRYDEARLVDLASANAVNVSAVDRADPPARPDNSRLFLLIVAGAGGLLLALLIALVREYFDRRLADPAAAEEILGVPDLGSVERLHTNQLPSRLRSGLP
ncbi:hypothetical protein BH11PSE10_BH11PSE10_06030 [soil metagenome]